MWPIFVSDDAENRVTVSPAESMIETRLKKAGGKYYLLTANASESTRLATIRIEGFEGMKVKKLFDLPAEMTVKSDTIEDAWTANDSFVYEIMAATQE